MDKEVQAIQPLRKTGLTVSKQGYQGGRMGKSLGVWKEWRSVDGIGIIAWKRHRVGKNDVEQADSSVVKHAVKAMMIREGYKGS